MEAIFWSVNLLAVMALSGGIGFLAGERYGKDLPAAAKHPRPEKKGTQKERPEVRRAIREWENFLTYDGTPQEDFYPGEEK
ncbi:MAG: hypothetical protein E7486_07465 [Ruminococcaceae bacterium]|nr:hypothetical protein [Oscillospiraceae bacterium]